MWRDHPFNQRSKTTERAVGVGMGVHRRDGRLDKVGKGGRQYKGGLQKIGGYDFSANYGIRSS